MFKSRLIAAPRVEVRLITIKMKLLHPISIIPKISFLTIFTTSHRCLYSFNRIAEKEMAKSLSVLHNDGDSVLWKLTAKSLSLVILLSLLFNGFVISEERLTPRGVPLSRKLTYFESIDEVRY